MSGSRYVAGKVIVKFRDGVSPAARSSALAVTSAKALLQPSYANFDVVAIDPNEDAEAAARALTARPDVEYAQAAYRVHTQFVPNDTNYRRGLQWNFPLIDLERAWVAHWWNVLTAIPTSAALRMSSGSGSFLNSVQENAPTRRFRIGSQLCW